MNPLFADFVLGPVFLVAGILTGIFFRGVPMRGWIALMLLFLSALIWMFTQPNDSSKDGPFWSLPCFVFIASVAVIYSFRSRKSAPDRLFSRVAFIASFLIAAALLLIVFAMICGLALALSSPRSVLHILSPTANPP